MSAESRDIYQQTTASEVARGDMERGRRCSLTVGEGNRLGVIIDATAAYSEL